jgi:hypothetical protein
LRILGKNMIIFRFSVGTAFLTALAVAACNGADSQARLCQASIKETLLNPETAEFYEFTSIDQETAERRFVDGLAKARNVNPQDRHSYPGMFEYWDKLASDTMSETAGKGGAFKVLRMKAENQVGQKVTQEFVCAATKDDCGCFSEGSIRAQALSKGRSHQ